MLEAKLVRIYKLIKHGTLGRNEEISQISTVGNCTISLDRDC